MKALFLVFHGFGPHNGISKKIMYQQQALKNLGVDVRLSYLDFDKDGNRVRYVDNEVIDNFGRGILSKFRKRVCYASLMNYIRENKIDFIYIRHNFNANPILAYRLKKLRDAGVKIILEIPTFPYDNEFKMAGAGHKMSLAVDKMFRIKMCRHVDKIVTFTDYKEIFGRPAIGISNGIDFKSVPVKPGLNDTAACLNLISVSEIHFWHGLDRVIAGMADYYEAIARMKKGGKEVSSYEYPAVRFHVAGRGYGKEFGDLQRMVRKKKLETQVIFYGNTSGSTLDRLFEKADFGIASLGRHRSGIDKIKTLKNREYAARGLPFVYSETDDDFERMPYVIKAPANDSALDIKRIVDFYRQLDMTPAQIRATVEDSLSWEVQMKKVVNAIL